MADEKDSVLFRRIEDPLGMRREILEASKDMIHGLQKYERLKAMRIKKAEEIARLKNIVKEISSLSAKLKKDFPDIMFKVPAPKKAESVSKKKGKDAAAAKILEKEEPREKESKELVDLEKQLRDIEGKLSKLG